MSRSFHWTALVTALCLTAPSVLAGQANRDAWTKPQDGLRTRVVVEQWDYKPREYGWICIDVWNVSKTTIQVSHDQWMKHAVELTGPDGKRLRPVDKLGEDYRSSLKDLPAGKIFSALTASA